MRIDLPIIVACPNVKGHGNERAKEEWDFSGKQGHQAYCHRYVCIYIYIYISVKEFERLLHCRSPLIFSFIYSIELSVDVEVKKFGALAMLCTISHIIVNLYIWVSHTWHMETKPNLCKRSHKKKKFKIYIRGMCNNFPRKSFPTMRVIIFTFTSWIWKYFKFLSCG